MGQIVASFLNYLFNVYLSRAITIEEFGLLSSMMSIIVLAYIPCSALGASVCHKTAFWLGKFQCTIGCFWARTRRQTIFAGLLLTGLWLVLMVPIQSYLNAPSILPFILFSPAWLLMLVSSVDQGFLGGVLNYKVLALLLVLDAGAKLLTAGALVIAGYPSLVYLSVPVSLAAVLGVAYYYARRTSQLGSEPIQAEGMLDFPKRFFASNTLVKFSTICFVSIDVILAKHFLEPAQAGEYAVLSLAGKIIFYFGTLMAPFIVPVISKAEGAGQSTRRTFLKLFLASSAASLSVYLAVGLLGGLTMPVLFGDRIRGVAYLLPSYGLGLAGFTVASVIAGFHQARSQHAFSAALFVVSLAQILAVTLFHDNLEAVAFSVAAVGVSSLFLIGGMHLLSESPQPSGSLSARKANPSGPGWAILPDSPGSGTEEPSRLRILMLNWRDTRHVWAGGAEMYVHEIARRLVSQGHTVTLFCGNDRLCPVHEDIDGVHVIRRGGFYLVYLWAAIYYLLRFRGRFDVILDSENGVPFFSPLYARLPVVGLIHHVHQGVFRQNLSKPLAWLACWLEGKAMPVVYRNCKMITVSQSSQADMKRIGLGSRRDIEIVHPGVEIEHFSPQPKTSYPSILYLGRIKHYKSIDTLVRAMPAILADFPEAKLRIAGFGEAREDLEALTSSMGLDTAVHFLGKVSEEDKTKLMGESWVFAYPSSMEGWGIAAIEANAAGTPVVAADVPGLRDSVRVPLSGYLVRHGDAVAFAKQIKAVFADPLLRAQLQVTSREWATRFTWDRSAGQLLQILKAQVGVGRAIGEPLSVPEPAQPLPANERKVA